MQTKELKKTEIEKQDHADYMEKESLHISEDEEFEEAMSKSEKKERNLSFVLLGSVILFLVLVYLGISLFYKDKCHPNTFVNGYDIGGLTAEKAKEALLSFKPVKNLQLNLPDGRNVEFKADDFEAEYSISDTIIDEVCSENCFTWINGVFNTRDYIIEYDYSYNKEKLSTMINEYQWGDEKAKNAEIIKGDDGIFFIEPETIGDIFDHEMLLQYTDLQLMSDNSDIDMEKSGCYDEYKAKVTTEDLKNKLELYNGYATFDITFDFKDRKKIITSDMIVDWIRLDENGAVLEDEDGKTLFNVDAVQEFVDEMAEETDTYGKDREFKSTKDGVITVPWVDEKSWDKNNCSIYGWKINREETVLKIIDMFHEKKTEVTEPVYYSWGTGYERATDDIGDTYVEADISEQHFWVYKDGKVVMEDDFVSGTETVYDRRTPRGIGKIADKATGIYLGTIEVQGYRTWVDYWMAFNYAGCGFHDLSRGAYGGEIYKYNGSHGCLNLNPETAKKMYDVVELGMPVIVHD